MPSFVQTFDSNVSNFKHARCGPLSGPVVCLWFTKIFCLLHTLLPWSMGIQCVCAIHGHASSDLPAMKSYINHTSNIYIKFIAGPVHSPWLPEILAEWRTSRQWKKELNKISFFGLQAGHLLIIGYLAVLVFVCLTMCVQSTTIIGVFYVQPVVNPV